MPSRRGQQPRRLAVIAAALAGILMLVACKASNNRSTATATAGQSRAPTAVAGTAAPPRTALAQPSTTVVSRPGTPGQIVLSANGATPDTVTVQAGRPVTFVNADSVPHHPVSVEAGLFDPGTIAPGTSAQVTVAAAGLHDWHDAANPRLSGTIRVVP